MTAETGPHQSSGTRGASYDLTPGGTWTTFGVPAERYRGQGTRALSSFLVQINRVTYKTENHVEWDYTSATATPSPTFRTGGNGADSQLGPDALRNRFHAQFPAFNCIR